MLCRAPCIELVGYNSTEVTFASQWSLTCSWRCRSAAGTAGGPSDTCSSPCSSQWSGSRGCYRVWRMAGTPHGPSWSWSPSPRPSAASDWRPATWSWWRWARWSSPRHPPTNPREYMNGTTIIINYQSTWMMTLIGAAYNRRSDHVKNPWHPEKKFWSKKI